MTAGPRRRVCVVTGTRAEYGLLKPVMLAIEQSAQLDLQLVVTGMHLSPEFGLTHTAIEADGFAIDDKLEILLSSDTPQGVAKAMGLGTIGFTDIFARLEPDLLMVLGDRFELLAAAQAALVARLPIAHLSGGDTTEGAVDEAIRHAITKMSHLHFVFNADAERRVRQLGEDPRHVHLVGNPGLDDLARFTPPTRDELGTELGYAFRERNLLVTFHPVTLDERPAVEPFAELLAAIDDLGPEVGTIFTMPNADAFGRPLITMIEEFVAERGNTIARTSLGQRLYWSTLAHVDVMVGNSSSGLIEAPAMQKPTVNIGNRQKGRTRGPSVIDVPPQRTAIAEGIRRSFELDCTGITSPYGDGQSTARIIAVLEEVSEPSALVAKAFHDIEVPT